MANKTKEGKETLFCSFCGKSQFEVKKLIAGPAVFICNECIELCMDVINAEETSPIIDHETGEISSPEKICQILNEYVVGLSLIHI